MLLTKEVEFDEAYFGSKRHRGKVSIHKRGRGSLKRPVFGVLERKGEVYTKLVPDSSRKPLQRVILYGYASMRWCTPMGGRGMTGG